MPTATTKAAESCILKNIDHFDLAQTLDCGQCFRWSENPDGSYTGVVGRRVLTLACQGDDLHLTGADMDAYREELAAYFALDQDYGALKALFAADPVLRRAMAYAPGIRVLRQDGWEALATFILSQNNNIKRIKGIVERLCQCFGEELEPGRYTFPAAEQLAELELAQLEPLRAGFRAKYLLDAAQKVAGGEVPLAPLYTLPLEEAVAMLCKIKGVGIKVASCTLLFGFGRVECFPEDVWIKRVMATLYPQGLPTFVRPYGGIAQQYLFHYARTCPNALDCGDAGREE